MRRYGISVCTAMFLLALNIQASGASCFAQEVELPADHYKDKPRPRKTAALVKWILKWEEWEQWKSEGGQLPEFEAWVTVDDGDTVTIREIAGEENLSIADIRNSSRFQDRPVQVRLCGIDAPEVEGAGRLSEPLSDRATVYLLDALDQTYRDRHAYSKGTKVRVRLSPRIVDKGGGRLLGWVYKDDCCLNERLVESGNAVPWRICGSDDPGERIWSAFLKSLRERGQGRTVWTELQRISAATEWTPSEHQFIHRRFKSFWDDGVLDVESRPDGKQCRGIRKQPTEEEKEWLKCALGRIETLDENDLKLPEPREEECPMYRAGRPKR